MYDISILNAKKASAISGFAGEQVGDLTAEIEKTETELSTLRVKLKKETQFNIKIVLNVELKKRK